GYSTVDRYRAGRHLPGDLRDRCGKTTDRAAVLADIDGVSPYVLLDYGPTNAAFLDMGVAYPREDASLMMNIYLRRGYLIGTWRDARAKWTCWAKACARRRLTGYRGMDFRAGPGDTLVLLREGSQTVVDAKDRGTAMAEWMGDHGTDLF